MMENSFMRAYPAYRQAGAGRPACGREESPPSLIYPLFNRIP
jgi:hypothetical protein